MPMLDYSFEDFNYPFYTTSYRPIPPSAIFSSFLYDTFQPVPWQDNTFGQTTDSPVLSVNPKSSSHTSRPTLTVDTQDFTQFYTQPYYIPLQGPVREHRGIESWNTPYISGCINHHNSESLCGGSENHNSNITPFKSSLYSQCSAPNCYISSSIISQISDKPKDAKKYICPICSHRSQRRHNLLEHIQTHNSNRIKRFSCIHCNRPFARKYDMRRHEKIHTRAKHSSH
ncbi:hypothetical protein F4703DRAFT_1821404 [Phycomyces blakesleeanus]